MRPSYNDCVICEHDGMELLAIFMPTNAFDNQTGIPL